MEDDNATNSTSVKDEIIKSEPEYWESDADASDNEEEAMYKNLTEDQLYRARKYNECFICQKRCKNFSSFRTHVFAHSSTSKFRCEKCFKEFAQLKYLKAHLTTHNENRSFFCEICSQNFATKPSIRGHMRVHTGEKPYKCSVCERAFSESSTRRKHMLTHFPGKKESFPCEVCGKVIKGMNSFKQHMAIHTGDKNVECPVCFKSFARKSSLRDHVLTHTAHPKDRLKGHICDVCSKAFHHRSSLWKHKKRACLPVKIAQCDFCVAIFKQKLAQMQGDSDKCCKICGQIFLKARGLSVHLRTHIADKIFQCAICANKYTPNENTTEKPFQT